MTLFGIDAASFQGNVDWATVDASTSFGWEKVTQGTTYVNPTWAHAKTGMAARAARSGFVPGAYLFLEATDGASQAVWFHKHAGNLDGFAIAVDVEPTTNSNPTLAQARACVAKLRQLYPGKPIVGYIPHWYWGGQDTTFVNVLWASNYVTAAPGSPASMYSHVTAAQWVGYGGRNPALLQFTNQAVVPGVAGHVDCSAYKGTAGELRAQLLGVPKPAAEGPPYRHTFTGWSTWNGIARRRNTTAAHLMETSAAAYTDGDKRRIAGLRPRRGTPYYTDNP
jgi:lysozyme